MTNPAEPRGITPAGDPPFLVGDAVEVRSPVEGDTSMYPGVVSAVSPIVSVDGGPITWLVSVYSTAWLPERLRQAAYDEDGNHDPMRAVLTLVSHGQWPLGISTDAGNQLTLGTDGGLYVGA